MLVFFFPFFENLGSYVYDSLRARVQFRFWKVSAQRFFRWEVVRHARACSRCACLPAPRARGRPRRLLLSRSTRRQRRIVDKCRVADKKQTNQQTIKQTNTHYSFIGIDLPPVDVEWSLPDQGDQVSTRSHHSKCALWMDHDDLLLCCFSWRGYHRHGNISPTNYF